MKRIALAIGGAILGYIVVAFTAGWFISGGPLLALLYIVGMVVGGVLAYRSLAPKAT